MPPPRTDCRARGRRHRRRRARCGMVDELLAGARAADGAGRRLCRHRRERPCKRQRSTTSWCSAARRASPTPCSPRRRLSPGGSVLRIAGADRYATAVEMARRLGGWWPTGDAADSAGSLVCIAASGGQGANSVGWPDALGAGPFCGAINGGAVEPRSSESRVAAGRWRRPVSDGWRATGARCGARAARDAAVVLVAGGDVEISSRRSSRRATGVRARRRFPRAVRPASPSRSVGVLSLPTKPCRRPRRLSPAAPIRCADDVTPTVAGGFTTGSRPLAGVRGRWGRRPEPPMLHSWCLAGGAVALGVQRQCRHTVRQRVRRDDDRAVRH